MPGPAIIISRRPTLVVTSAGSEVPEVQLDADWQYEFGKPAVATVNLNRLVSWLDFWSPITIAAGATDATVAVRGSYFIWDFPAFQHAPRGTVLDLRGPLIKMEFVPPTIVQNGAEIPGIDLSGMTSAQQIVYLLNAKGLAGQFDAADIGGSPYRLGTQSAEDATVTPGKKNAHGSRRDNIWPPSTSALAFTAERDKFDLGWRLCETLVPGRGLRIIRPQISPRPSGRTPVVTLTEAAPSDIAQGSTASHSANIDTYNWVEVTGYDDGSGPVRALATAGHPHPPPGLAFVADPQPPSSPLIEKRALGDPGEGMACDLVAAWRLGETNHVQLKLEITTPNDYPFNLRDEVGVYAPDRMQVAQNFWTRSVKGSLNGSGMQQRLSLRAPAAVGRGGISLPISLSYPDSPGVVLAGGFS
jgi:hypothetical protein